MAPNNRLVWQGVLLLAAIAFYAAQGSSVLCPAGYHAAGTRCYLISQDQMTWVTAGKFCKSLGASLAATETLSEYHALKALMLRVVPTLPPMEFQANSGNIKNFWLGGYYNTVQTKYWWYTSGKSRVPIDLSWAPVRHAGDGRTDYCMLYQHSQWYFYDCGFEFAGAVCEAGPVGRVNPVGR